MTADELRQHFPNASEQFIRANDDGRPKRELWTIAQVSALTRYYTETPDSDFSIYAISEDLGKSSQSTALKASELGLTNQKRGKSDAHRIAMGKERKKRYQDNPENHPRPDWTKKPHPKGMLGKHHTAETRAAISIGNIGRVRPANEIHKMIGTKIQNGSLHPKHPHGKWKAAWVEIGGQRFYARSRWEANYARYLEWLKTRKELFTWEHEPETFWFEKIRRGARTYLPDFRITTNSGQIEYHEVKGWMDSQSATKLRRMTKYFPEVKLVLIDSPRYKSLARQLANIVPGWEI